jgi:hypothetical protein
MRYLLIILGVFIFNLTQASIIGSGILNAGVSKDESKENFGLAGSYNLISSGSNFDSLLNSEFQLGSDQGRSLVATSAHEYQYEQSFFQSYGSLGYVFPISSFRWSNSFIQRTELIEESESILLGGNSGLQESQDSWSISTGPSFLLGRSRWISFRSSGLYTKSSTVGDLSDEFNLSIGLGKSISTFSTLFFDTSRICNEYKAEGIKDVCRDEFTLALETTQKYLEFSLEAGISRQDDIDTSIYSFEASYVLNSSSEFNINLYKASDRLRDLTSNALNRSDFEMITLRTGASINYRYEWGNTEFEIKGRSVETQFDNNITETSDAAVFYEYHIGSVSCFSCRVELGYEYSEFGSGSNQIINSISLKKNNSKRIISSISFRQTKFDDVDVWSINFLLTYNGESTFIGPR